MGNTTDLIAEVTQGRTSLLACISSLSASSSFFLVLVEKIETKAREVNEREKELKEMEEVLAKRTIDMEDTIAKRSKELAEKQIQLDKREEEMDKKANLLLELEKKWNETQQRMKENAAKLPTLVHLSVGGKRFAIPKDTLIQQKGSYFEAMLTTDTSQQINGEFYIDYSPKYFKFVVDFLRSGKIATVEVPLHQNEIQEYFSHFGLPNPFPPLAVHSTLPTQITTSGPTETKCNIYYDLENNKISKLLPCILQHFPTAKEYKDFLPHFSLSVILSFIIFHDWNDLKKWIPICEKRMEMSDGRHFVILVCEQNLKIASKLACRQLFITKFVSVWRIGASAYTFLPETADAAFATIKSFIEHISNQMEENNKYNTFV